MPYVQLGNLFFSVAMKICDFARSEFTTFLNNNYYYSVHRRDVPDPKERILADRKAKGAAKLGNSERSGLASPSKNSALSHASLVFVLWRTTCAKVYCCDRCDVVIYNVLVSFTNTFVSVGAHLLVRFDGYPPFCVSRCVARRSSCVCVAFLITR